MFKVISERRSDVFSVVVLLSIAMSCLTSPALRAQPARVRVSNTFGAAAAQEDFLSIISGLGTLRPIDKISARVFAETADGKNASVVIMLEDQADVSGGYQIADDGERGWYVYNTLTSHAERTQESLKTFLKEQGRSYRSFWAANMIVADVDRVLLMKVAERADVARIDSNHQTRWIEEPEIANRKVAVSSPATANAIQWGVTNVNAPSVWSQGFTGQGIVIGGLDTGIRWTHDAIKGKYRGWNGSSANHNYNWWDAVHVSNTFCAASTTVPCDDDGHGTHTIGTVVGDDGAGNQIGVAPGAKWIGCRNMNQGNGTPATYTECFQFMIAPTNSAGAAADPSLRPHILNNSWACPPSEGCTTGTELETIINNTQAAGIFVSFSAGNSGPGCDTVSTPGAFYDGAFSVGAFNENNLLASFSSRGPSTFSGYSPRLMKPNLSAPGVSVRSALETSDTAYAALSGTSMASPHVAGVVALLWSARPLLVRDIAATRALLQSTANPSLMVTSVQTCGGIPTSQIPNNSFGYGRVDALAAVNRAPINTSATVSGRVLSPSGAPLRNVRVIITPLPTGAERSVITNSAGYYSFENVPTGIEYRINVLSRRYKLSAKVRMINADLASLDFAATE